MRGLLLTPGRKTISAMAQSAKYPFHLKSGNSSQALQNFINKSPWDENLLWRRYRVFLAGAVQQPCVCVLSDLGLSKQGVHTVGVQRQYWSGENHKINCQVAVVLHVIHHVFGALPVALQLYLPMSWINDSSRLDAARVPYKFRQHQRKSEIALKLLDEIRQEGMGIQSVVITGRFGSSGELREGLQARGLPFLINGEQHKPPQTRPSCDTLGEFKGGLLDPGSLVQRSYQTMKNELGLDHFEGRSWHGFHHHLCLVAVAYGFLVTQSAT